MSKKEYELNGVCALSAVVGVIVVVLLARGFGAFVEDFDEGEYNRECVEHDVYVVYHERNTKFPICDESRCQKKEEMKWTNVSEADLQSVIQNSPYKITRWEYFQERKCD